MEAVARVLGLDQAVVSRRLKGLRTGYALLQNRGRNLELTEKGRLALPAIRTLVRQHDHLAGWLADRQSQPRMLSIATGSLGSRLYLPRALALFAERHPDWQVRVQVRRGRERILGTAEGTCDLAIVSHDEIQIRAIVNAPMGEKTRLRIEPLVDHTICVLAPKGTPAGVALARSLEGQSTPLTRLTDFDLVGLDPQSGIRRQLESHFARSGRSLRFRVEAGGWDAAREFSRHGLGVAILPLCCLARDDQEHFVIRRLAPEVRIRDILIDRDGEMGAEHEAMRQAIREAVAEHQEEVDRRWSRLL